MSDELTIEPTQFGEGMDYVAFKRAMEYIDDQIFDAALAGARMNEYGDIDEHGRRRDRTEAETQALIAASYHRTVDVAASLNSYLRYAPDEAALNLVRYCVENAEEGDPDSREDVMRMFATLLDERMPKSVKEASHVD